MTTATMQEAGTRDELGYFRALSYLGIEHDDMQDRIKMNRMQSVLDFASAYKDGLNVIRKIAMKAPRPERVDRAFEYVGLRKQLSQRIDQNASGEVIRDLKRAIEAYEK